MGLSQEDPVQFRVRDIVPNPRTFALAEEFTLSIDYVNKPGGITFATSSEWLAPYRETLQEAIDGHDVYWVNWHYPDNESWPPKPDDSPLERLIQAIASKQVVPHGD